MPKINIDFHPKLNVAGRKELVRSEKIKILSSGFAIVTILIHLEAAQSLEHPVDDYTLSLADCFTINTLSDGTN